MNPLPSFESIKERSSLLPSSSRLGTPRKHAAPPFLSADVAWRHGRAQQYGWQDTYVFTKSMGEMMLSRYLKKSKFAAAVVRPSIVESSTSEPLRGWIEGLRSALPPPPLPRRCLAHCSKLPSLPMALYFPFS